jgi:NAD(P)-dependent dehydrogenase (short-subunit alcohol dehydrogenase family)
MNDGKTALITGASGGIGGTGVADTSDLRISQLVAGGVGTIQSSKLVTAISGNVLDKAE